MTCTEVRQLANYDGKQTSTNHFTVESQLSRPATKLGQLNNLMNSGDRQWTSLYTDSIKSLPTCWSADVTASLRGCIMQWIQHVFYNSSYQHFTHSSTIIAKFQTSNHSTFSAVRIMLISQQENSIYLLHQLLLEKSYTTKFTKTDFPSFWHLSSFITVCRETSNYVKMYTFTSFHKPSNKWNTFKVWQTCVWRDFFFTGSSSSSSDSWGQGQPAVLRYDSTQLQNRNSYTSEFFTFKTCNWTELLHSAQCSKNNKKTKHITLDNRSTVISNKHFCNKTK